MGSLGCASSAGGAAARRTTAAGMGPLLWLLLLGLLWGPRPVCAEPGDELSVSLLTLSPGRHPFARFGHIEIWIHDAAAPPEDPLRRDAVYNFGNFRFDDPALIPKFILGRFVYWLAKDSLAQRIEYARRLQRSIDAQELSLSGAQKRALRAALEENLQESKRYYKYDYYRDNCATRVRDVIDQVIGGRLRQGSQGPAAMSYRAHTLRLTADDVPLSLALTTVLSGFTDQPISAWDEMFLATYIQKGVRQVQIPGPDGRLQPLVRGERRLIGAPRPIPEREAAPAWLPAMLSAGLTLGGVLFALARSAVQHRLSRRLLAVLLGLLGGLSAGGGFLIFVWVGTDHQACYANQNILQLLPLGVAQIWLCRGVARLQPEAIRRARILLSCAAAASVFGLVWKVLPWLRQDNLWVIALCAPLWIGGALGLGQLETDGRARSRPQPTADRAAGR